MLAISASAQQMKAQRYKSVNAPQAVKDAFVKM